MHTGRFHNLPFFDFGPNFLDIKKCCIHFGNQWEVAKYKGRTQIFNGQHPNAFGPILGSQQEKKIVLKDGFKTSTRHFIYIC